MALCIVMVTYSYKENARSKHSLDFGIFKKNYTSKRMFSLIGIQYGLWNYFFLNIYGSRFRCRLRLKFV